MAVRATQILPRRPQLVGVRAGVLPALLRELVGATSSVARLGPDQAFVFQLLQRRVNRAWARPPYAAAPLADLLNDLVAVHGLLGDQRECGCANVAAPGPGPAHAAPFLHPRPEPVHARSAGESGNWREAELRSAKMTGPAAAARPRTALLVVVVVVVPPSCLCVIGRFPAARAAVLPVLVFVSHCSLHPLAFRAPVPCPAVPDYRRSNSIAQRYIVDIQIASPEA